MGLFVGMMNLRCLFQLRLNADISCSESVLWLGFVCSYLPLTKRVLGFLGCTDTREPDQSYLNLFP